MIKDAFDKKRKQGLEMTPYGIEQLAKQTLLRSSEFEIWVRHLSDARKHRQAGSQKATAKRKGNHSRSLIKLLLTGLNCGVFVEDPSVET